MNAQTYCSNLPVSLLKLLKLPAHSPPFGAKHQGGVSEQLCKPVLKLPKFEQAKFEHSEFAS
jgi:hypothetical protein